MDLNKYAGILMVVNAIDVIAGIVVAVVLAGTKEKEQTPSSGQAESLQNQLKSALEKYDSLQKELKKKCDELRVLKDAGAKTPDLSAVVDKLKKEIEVKNGSIADLQKQISPLQEELKKSKAAGAAAENQLQESKKKEAALDRELSQQKDSSKDINTELEKLKKEAAGFKEKAAAKEKELEQALAKLSELDKQFKNKDAEVESLKAQNALSADLAQQFSKLKSETENQNNAIKEFKNKEKEIQDKIISLNNELSAAKNKNDSIEKDFKKKEEELKSAKAENAKIGDLNAQIQKLKGEIETQVKTISELGSKDKADLNQINALQNELKAAKDNYKVAETEFKRKSDELAVLKAQAAEKDKESLKQISSLQNELKSAKDNCLIAEQEFKRKSEEIQSLKAENAKIGELTVQLNKLKTEGQTQANIITELKNKDQEKFNRIKSLEEELKAAKNNCDSLGKEIEAKNNAVTQLENKEKELENQIGSLEKENLEYEDALSESEEELKELSAEYAFADKELKSKIEEISFLKSENAKISDLTARVQSLTKEKEDSNKANEELKKEIRKLLRGSKQENPEEEPEETEQKPESNLGRKDKKIGQILIEQKFITEDMLKEAINYQEKYGGTVTKYLIAYGYIDEVKLAQCLCHQFGVPYLPLSSYEISEDIIKLVPIDIAEKYWLIPVQKVGSSLTIIMADPFDSQAISAVEKITRCKVQPFVGILSDIIQALEGYYKVIINEGEKKGKKEIPCFITTEAYKGLERRQWARFNAAIDVYFPFQGRYTKSVTKDVSRGGFLFETDAPLEIGSTIPLEVHLPKEASFWPILAVVQVLRIQSSQNGKFAVGTKIIKIAKEEIDVIIKYATTNKEG